MNTLMYALCYLLRATALQVFVSVQNLFCSCRNSFQCRKINTGEVSDEFDLRPVLIPKSLCLIEMLRDMRHVIPEAVAIIEDRCRALNLQGADIANESEVAPMPIYIHDEEVKAEHLLNELLTVMNPIMFHRASELFLFWCTFLETQGLAKVVSRYILMILVDEVPSSAVIPVIVLRKRIFHIGNRHTGEDK